VNPNAPKYTPPAYTDPKITVTKCGAPMKANGMCGDPIAYRTKLEPTSGNITITFQPLYIPDRCVVTKFVNNTATIIHDTGYVSSDPTQTQVEFGKLLDELNKTKPNGYDGKIKSPSGNISITLNDPKATYYIEVYAPLGPTLWSAELLCQVGGSEGGGTPPFPLPAGVDANISFTKIYFNKDHTGFIPYNQVNKESDIAYQGELKNGKYFNGKQFEYDDAKILLRVWDWKSGKKATGTLSSKV
jgi:hypothetical protein